MSNKQLSDEEVAAIRMRMDKIRGEIGSRMYALPTEAERLASLALTDVRKDARNPQQLEKPPEPVKHSPVNWVGEKPLKFVEKGSVEERILDGMTRRYVGGPNDPVK